MLEVQQRMHDIEVRQHRALRRSRRAGGIEDDHGFLLVHLGRRHIAATGWQGTVNEQPRAAVGDDVFHFRRREAHADRHGDRAQMQDAEQRGGELDAVAEAHGDAVAPAHAARGQGSGHPDRAFAELRER